MDYVFSVSQRASKFLCIFVSMNIVQFKLKALLIQLSDSALLSNSLSKTVLLLYVVMKELPENQTGTNEDSLNCTLEKWNDKPRFFSRPRKRRCGNMLKILGFFDRKRPDPKSPYVYLAINKHFLN